MTIERYCHLFLFDALATAIPWAFGFTAAYLSHIEPTNPSKSRSAFWPSSG